MITGSLYPLIAPKVSPDIIRLYRKIDRRIVGIVQITDNAEIHPHSTPVSKMLDANEMVMVVALERVRMSANKNSYHEKMKVKKVTVAMLPQERGNITLKKDWSLLQPSVKAASSRTQGKSAQ